MTMFIFFEDDVKHRIIFGDCAYIDGPVAKLELNGTPDGGIYLHTKGNERPGWPSVFVVSKLDHFNYHDLKKLLNSIEIPDKGRKVYRL